jgi:hypothetical protein
MTFKCPFELSTFDQPYLHRGIRSYQSISLNNYLLINSQQLANLVPSGENFTAETAFA